MIFQKKWILPEDVVNKPNFHYEGELVIQICDKKIPAILVET